MEQEIRMKTTENDRLIAQWQDVQDKCRADLNKSGLSPSEQVHCQILLKYVSLIQNVAKQHFEEGAQLHGVESAIENLGAAVAGAMPRHMLCVLQHVRGLQ